ncbi:MAG: dephospho-CoA kinase [Thermodesulfobacteriota bacterium]
MIVGITGSIGTGKSTVSKMFGEMGAVVIDYDLLAREAVLPGRPAYNAIVKRFGASFLSPDGTIARDKLGDLVFRDPDARRDLNAIVHPEVFTADLSLTRDVLARNPQAVIVKEIPLLTQIGIDPKSLVDKVVVVSACRATQIARVCGRGFTPEQAEERVASQAPIQETEGFADFVIQNDGSLEDTRAQVRRVYSALAEEAKRTKT